MTSASTPEPDVLHPAGAAAGGPPAARGLFWRGLAAGAAAGAVVGIADTARALLAANEVLGPGDAPGVVVRYAVLFAPCGLAAALVARRAAWPRRMLALLVGTGAALFFVVALLNVRYLPGFTSGLSLFADLVLLGAAAWWVRRRYRAAGADEIRVGRWLMAGAAAVLLAVLLPMVVAERGSGPAPEAAATPGSARPNVLLYVADTLRADHLGAYGYELPTSPELDAFARDAVLFEDCRAPSSWTKPSTASLLTGLYPSTHACVEQRELLVPEAETLAEVLRTAGWRTAAFSDNPFVSPEFGFGQGFDAFDRERPDPFVNGTLLGKALFMTRLVSLTGTPFGVGEENEDRGARRLHARVLEFAAQPDERPWFAYVHAMEPHLPYAPPRALAERFGLPKDAEYRSPPAYNGILPFDAAPAPDPEVLSALRAQYDGEIADLSDAFGELMEVLLARGVLEDTVIVFASDHGEEFHEHGGWTHGHSLHREVVQVPLMVRVPDRVAEAARAGRGRRVGGVVSLLDVFPTVLELCSVRHPRGEARLRDAAGPRSLVPFLFGQGDRRPRDHAPPDRPVLGEVTMEPVWLRSLREGRWLRIEAGKPLEQAAALYDDVADPRHAKDRAEKHDLESAQMRARMAALFDALREGALRGASREIDPETGERLRGLGYK